MTELIRTVALVLSSISIFYLSEWAYTQFASWVRVNEGVALDERGER